MERSHQRNLLTFIILITFLFPYPSCSSNKTNEKKKPVAEKPAQPEKTSPGVIAITSDEQFKAIIDTSGDRLLIFDLYADWCMPCKILSPTLEELARENSGKASFYKINVDVHTQIAGMFGVSGIPFVVFVKNKTGVHALTGVNPKGTYQRAIDQFAGSESSGNSDTPDGEIINDTRVIKLTTSTSLGNIYVYRGDHVKLIIDKIDLPYSIQIPKFNIAKDGIIGENLEVSFTTDEIGVFPIYCNGQCPTGDGSQFGQIIVMQYKASGDAQFIEMKTEEAKKFIEKNKPLVLDVRTPNEFYRGHLANATLIPLQQLKNRLKEIEGYKEKEILIYCRSGNRSTVASQILIQNGFKKLYNLQNGIVGWQKKGYPTAQ
jgi:thioredoxin